MDPGPLGQALPHSVSPNCVRNCQLQRRDLYCCHALERMEHLVPLTVSRDTKSMAQLLSDRHAFWIVRLVSQSGQTHQFASVSIQTCSLVGMY